MCKETCMENLYCKALLWYNAQKLSRQSHEETCAKLSPILNDTYLVIITIINTFGEIHFQTCPLKCYV